MLLGSCFAARAAQMGGPALVKVAEAAVKDIAPVTRVPGTVVSRNDARLSAEVPGRLTAVADVGTEVKAGEPVAGSRTRLCDCGMTSCWRRLHVPKPGLRFLESEEQRFSQLAEINLAAVTQLEQTRSDRDVARGDLEMARASLGQNADQLTGRNLWRPSTESWWNA